MAEERDAYFQTLKYLKKDDGAFDDWLLWEFDAFCHVMTEREKKDLEDAKRRRP